MREKQHFQHALRMVCLLVVMQLFAFASQAQVTISGKVTGKGGMGIPDISVSVKNTNVGTVTDGSGNFRLVGDVAAG
jgi:hypothetical protein